MPSYNLAQLNLAAMKYPLESPEMMEFNSNLDRLNSLAESAPGFVWRLQTDDGDATAIRAFGDNTLVNLSVWQDLATLRSFVYGTQHSEIMRRRREWFDRMQQSYLVLWWVPASHLPGLDEAKSRLEMLQENGPGPDAFNFSKAWQPPV